MQIPEARIELAASREESRYALQAVKLDKGAGRLIAADGRILASIQAQADETDATGLIPREAFVEARRLARKRDNRLNPAAVRIAVGRNVRVYDANSFIELEGVPGKFPDYAHLIPERDSAATICLDANLLVRLATALGAENRDGRVVRLWVGSPTKPVYVEPINGNGGFGLVMPFQWEQGS